MPTASHEERRLRKVGPGEAPRRGFAAWTLNIIVWASLLVAVHQWFLFGEADGHLPSMTMHAILASGAFIGFVVSLAALAILDERAKG